MSKNLHCVNFAPTISKTVVRLSLLEVNIKIAVTFAIGEEGWRNRQRQKTFPGHNVAKFLSNSQLNSYFLKDLPVCSKYVGIFCHIFWEFLFRKATFYNSRDIFRHL